MKINDTLNQSVINQRQLTDEIIDSVFDSRRLQGYPLKLQALNDLIGGIRTSTFTILAADTGMGKSLLSLNIMVDLAKSGVKCCYFDLENGTEETLERLYRIYFEKSVRYFESERNKEDFVKNVKKMDNIEYFSHTFLSEITHKKGIELLSYIINDRVKNGYKVFFIDPLEALETQVDPGKSFNEQGMLVKALKEIAQKLDIAIIVNHHTRKSTYSSSNLVENLGEVAVPRYKVPTLDDLKGSGKISDFSTDCWAMIRQIASKDENELGLTLFRVLKSRKKRLGDVMLYLDTNTLIFHPHEEYRRRTTVIYGNENYGTDAE